MRNARVWLLAVLIITVLAGSTVLIATAPSTAATQEKVWKDHWRYHDNHWNYWNEGDRRWYYTDGSNWYYHDNDAWRVYPFDKQFGRERFERGEYKVPGPDLKIEMPRHGVF